MVYISKEIEEATSELRLSNETLRKFMAKLLHEFNLGLGRDTNPHADIKMYPTYVHDLPNGRETGKFLALDLGGTNFRVLLITMEPDNFSQASKIYVIPNQIMTGSGESLFKHIAVCLEEFVLEHLPNEQTVLPLGFTFSFPLTQKGLTKGYLVRWTKGFNCEGVVGKDVVMLLQNALHKYTSVKIDVVAIVNDTTGTLMASAYTHHDCYVGLILGTGTNMCYLERTEKVETYDGPKTGINSDIIINCESGAFGECGVIDFIRTEFDREVDERSINRGTQIFEKMLSGMYMGEIVRLALVKLINQGLIFRSWPNSQLFEPGRFYTKYVSEIESNLNVDHCTTRMILEELGIMHASAEELSAVRYVCELVSRRSAFLAAAEVATVLNKMDRPSVTVGIDGSLYRYHPHFHNLMTEKMKELVKPGIKFQLVLSEDGSGKGAALVAAVAAKKRDEKR